MLAYLGYPSLGRLLPTRGPAPSRRTAPAPAGGGADIQAGRRVNGPALGVEAGPVEKGVVTRIPACGLVGEIGKVSDGNNLPGCCGLAGEVDSAPCCGKVLIWTDCRVLLHCAWKSEAESDTLYWRRGDDDRNGQRLRGDEGLPVRRACPLETVGAVDAGIGLVGQVPIKVGKGNGLADRHRASGEQERAILRQGGDLDELEGVTAVVVGEAAGEVGGREGQRRSALGIVFRHESVDGDGERLDSRGVLPAVGRAAAVLEHHFDGGRAAGVRGGGVCQVAGGRIDAWGDGEEARVVVGGNHKAERLAGEIPRAVGDAGRPAEDRLRAGVLEDRLVCPGGEGWRLVDRADTERHGGRRCGVELAVGGGPLEGVLADEAGVGRIGEVGQVGGEDDFVGRDRGAGQLELAVGGQGSDLDRLEAVAGVRVAKGGRKGRGRNGVGLVFDHRSRAAGNGRADRRPR